MMMNHSQKKIRGFSLIEMLLVMVIISSIIYMGIGYVQTRALNDRIDRTAAQMQQILNAALSYYVNNGSWPAGPTLSCLQGTMAAPCNINYLPATVIDPLGGGAAYAVSSTATNFTVRALVSQPAGKALGIATILAGKLPLSYTTSTASTVAGSCLAATVNCNVYATVNIPGQNLNNATAVNFAGVYHNGACVPIPGCPTDSLGNVVMTPEIIVAPAAVSGVNDAPAYNAGNCNATNTAGCAANAYPLTSFTARATGSTAANGNAGVGPPSCSTGSAQECFQNYNGNNPAGGQNRMTGTFWRVCLDVVTEKGIVVPASNEQGQLMGTIMVITKCRLTNESSGSDTTVYTP